MTHLISPKYTSVLSLATALVLGLSACSQSSAPESAESSAGTASSTSASHSAPASATASQSGASDQSSEDTASTDYKPEKNLYDGTTEIFKNKRYVALYGTPGDPSLGALGEQDVAGSVTRVKELASEYQPYAQETVTPTFEIITTVASGAPGDDGDYSDEAPIDSLLPMIEEAESNGIYVVLDFQPGRSDFLSQIKRYEKLLKHPNVGVGIDPEWRLAPNQVHLEQIGSVDAAEINDVLDYLAGVVDKNHLPQKMVVLHQFTLDMIQDRETLDVSHPELALTLHADGHGETALKLDGYATLLKGLNKKIRPSWKNFYDEDIPMLTPEQTYALNPKPWVVTYQ